MALTQISTKGIKDGTITNADINASAAIAGTKINPDFGSQDITTTGSIPATRIDIGGVTTNSAMQVTFSTSSSGTGKLLAVDSTSSKFTYNPSSNLLQVDNIATNGIEVAGNINLQNLFLSGELNMTQGSDAQRFFDAAVGTSALTFRGTTGGDANHEEMARFFRGGACELNHAGTKRFETQSGGALVTGNFTVNSGNVTVNNNNNQVYLQAHDGSIELTRTAGGAYIDFKNDLTEDNDARIQESNGGFSFTGTANIGNSLVVTNEFNLGGEINMVDDGNKNRFIDASLADNQALHIRATTNGDQNHENMALFHRNLGVNLYFDNSQKFSTIATGVKIENSGTANRLGTTAGDSSNLLQLHQEDVTNNTTYDFLNFRFTNGSSHSSSEMRFRRHVDVTPMGYFGLRDGANTFGYGTSELMRLTSGGNFGIGTTNPTSLLHVKSGIVDLTARFENSKTGDNDINYIGVGLNSGTTGTALFGHTGHSTAASQAAWFGLAGDDVAGGTGVKAFKGGTIFMAGVLNIGNSNAPRISGCRIATSGGAFGAFFETTGNTAANGIPLILNRQADNGVMIEFKQANSVVATILRNSSNQMVYGGQSDYRLKENNVAISDSLTKIKSLKPYEFNWKDLPDTKVLGFFAHELQEVVPQAVTGTKDEMYEDDDTKPKYQNVDNSHIVPLLVAAVQELTTKTEALETEVAALKAS